jgi:hypothetical protein
MVYVKLTVKIVIFAVNRQSLVTERRYLRSLFAVPFLNDAVCAQHRLCFCLELQGSVLLFGVARSGASVWSFKEPCFCLELQGTVLLLKFTFLLVAPVWNESGQI